MSGSDRSRHSAKSDNPRTVHHGRWNGRTWRLSRQTASQIGTVESRRFLVSQPNGTVEKGLREIGVADGW